MLKLFTAHPASVGESYTEHMAFALRVGGTMVTAGAACCVHGVLPFLFTATGSRAIRSLHRTIETRGRPQPAVRMSRADASLDYVI